MGVVVPFDFAQDRELWRWIPDHAQLHLTPTPFVPSPMTEGRARAISEEALVVLYDGAVATAQMDKAPRAAQTARHTAELVLDNSGIRTPGPRG